MYALKNAGYVYNLSMRLFSGISMAGLLAFFVVFAATTQLPGVIQSAFLVSLVSGLMIALVYLLSLYFFKVITPEEIHFLRSLKSK